MILKERGNRTWVEPFVGGGNIIDKVEGKRIGADINEYLIKALILIRDDLDMIPDLITEDDYEKSKHDLDVNGLTGFIGFSMSFGGKWFGGYRRDVAGTKGCIENMRIQTQRSKRSAIKQSKNLQGVTFINKDYRNLPIPLNSLIYCDPPYKGTTKYKNNFDHIEFWEWCRDKVKEGHIIFVSEYNAPVDFECIWSKEIINSLSKNISSKKGLEKLFCLKNKDINGNI